jgi:hypothetical protein
MRYLLLIIVVLIGCSPKVSSDIYWINQYGEKVPIVIQDTTFLPDTIK